MTAGRTVFASGAAVALYTAAAFGLLVYAGTDTAFACLLAAAVGVVVAALASRVVRAELARQAPVEMAIEPEPEPGDDAEPVPASTDGPGGGFSIAESREERASREIQAGLLPRGVPRVDGYQIEVAYAPCGALGGDFYDFIPCADDRLLITLGDVSGKGPAGAIIMAMVQTLLRREARDATGPADLLRRVNDGFAGTVAKGVFVTAQVAMLDARRHTLTLAGAGHHPMLLLNPLERRTTHVNAKGVALGLVAGERFAEGLGETQVDIAVGDSLLLYTDGATECAEHIATGMGESRFLAAAAAAVLPGPTGALKRLGDDLWQDGGRRRDDTTLLLISRAGAETALPHDRKARNKTA